MTNGILNIFKSKAFAIIIILTYTLVRFVFDSQLATISPYASYIFEGLLVIMITLIYKSDLFFKVKNIKLLLIEVACALVGGYLIYKIAPLSGITIPFNLEDGQTILFLLLIGPVLEEFLFRQTLWSLIKRIFDSELCALWGTALLFSFGHFFAYFQTPEFVHNFIFYQTAYTLTIGVWWGYRKYKSRELTSPLLLHMLFNLGFFAGYLV